MLENVQDIAQKSKSFWRRPEGTPGLIALALVLIAGVMGLSAILPWIITLLTNTLHAMLLLIAIAAITAMVMNRRFRKLVAYIFRSIMRVIASTYTTVNPIGIMENYLEDIRDNLEFMGEQIKKLNGQLRRVKNVIATNIEEYRDQIQMAKTAKDKGKQAQLVLSSRQAGRLKKTTITYQQLSVTMEKIYRVLLKMQEVAHFMYQDLEAEVRVKKQEREVVLTAHSAIKGAMAAIKGDPDAKEMFDRAMDHVVDDIGQRVGEMDYFIEISQGFIDSVDLQNGMFEAEALAVIEEWEQKGESILLGNVKDTLLLEAADDRNILDLDAPVQEFKTEPVLVEEKRMEKGADKYKRIFSEG